MKEKHEVVSIERGRCVDCGGKVIRVTDTSPGEPTVNRFIHAGPDKPDPYEEIEAAMARIRNNTHTAEDIELVNRVMQGFAEAWQPVQKALAGIGTALVEMGKRLKENGLLPEEEK